MYKTFTPSEFNFLSTNSYLTQFNKLYNAICTNNHSAIQKILGGADLFKQHSVSSLNSIRKVWKTKLNSWKRTQTKGWNAVVQHADNLLKLKKIVEFLKQVAENETKFTYPATAYQSLIIINEAMLSNESKYEMLVFVEDWYGVQEGVKECEQQDYCEKREYLASTFDAYTKAKYRTRKNEYIKKEFRFELKEKEMSDV